MRRLRHVALLLVLLAGAPRAADASVSISVSLDELAQESTAVVEGTPVSQLSVWENGRIVSYTEIQVESVVAGSVDGSTVWVRTLGGAVGHIGQSVGGEAVFTVGKHDLLFLHPSRSAQTSAYAVTDRAQGQFPIVVAPDGSRRLKKSSAIGLALKHYATDVAAAEVLDRLSESDGRTLIVKAWGQMHAP